MATFLHANKSKSFRLAFTICLLMLLQLESSSQNCSVKGGLISTSDATGMLCSGDGISDIVSLNVTNSVGPNSRILITNDLFEIVAISESTSVDFEGKAPALIRFGILVLRAIYRGLL